MQLYFYRLFVFILICFFVKISFCEVPASIGPLIKKKAPIFKGHNLPRLRGAMVNPDMRDQNSIICTGQDIAVLCSPTTTPVFSYHGNSNGWNANVFRWQILQDERDAASVLAQYGTTLSDVDMSKYRNWIDYEISLLDNVMTWAKSLQTYVVIDLHTWPGASTNNSLFHYNVDLQNEFVLTWQKIATKCKNSGVVWGYDLANEPGDDETHNSGYVTWHDLAERAAIAIRAIDQTTAIIVEPPLGGCSLGFQNFMPINSSNIVYSFHLYQPGDFTHQNTIANKSYPGVMNDSTFWDKSRMRTYTIEYARMYQLTYGVHIFVGEFSAANYSPGNSAFNYLNDAISIFEEFGWDWCYHAFRESSIWSVETGTDISQNLQQKRIDLLKQYFSTNVKPIFP